MAEDYLEDLIGRNLILVCAHRLNGKIKSFRVHDLLRELCLRVAHKEELFYVAEAPVMRRWLRVLNRATYRWPIEAKFQNVNLRYVACRLSNLPFSISLIWNLQTLIINGGEQLIVAPYEIWKMTQLRHLKFDRLLLPDPLPGDDKDAPVVLGNLHTLSIVLDFRMSEEACKRIPNIKKICLRYGYIWQVKDNTMFDNLQNLGPLQRLESLNLWCCHETSISKLKYTLPSSLKKLYIGGRFVCYERIVDDNWFVAPTGSSQAESWVFTSDSEVELC